MTTVKICPICNSEFIPKVHSQKYCNDLCYKNYRIIYKKQWSKEKSRFTKYTLICTICKTEFSSLKQNQKYCSVTCKEKHRKSYKLIYHKNRYKNDPEYKIRSIIRTRIFKAFESQLSNKKYSSINYLGCTGDFYKQYLESLFVDDMSWSNWGNGPGKWNIDHIIPINSFNLLNDKEAKKCFYYKNTQPLWWEENMKKSGGHK